MALVTHWRVMMEVCCLICTDTGGQIIFFFLRKRDPEGEKNHFTENDKTKRRWFIGAGSHADTQAQSQFHLLF